MPRNPIRLFDDRGRPVYFDVHFEKRVGQHTLLLVAPRDNPSEGGLVVAEVVMPNGQTDYHIVRDDDVTNFVFEAYKESRHAPAKPSGSSPWNQHSSSRSDYANMGAFNNPRPSSSGTSYWNKRLNTSHYPYAMTPPPELINLGYADNFSLTLGNSGAARFRHLGDVRYRGHDYVIAANLTPMPGYPVNSYVVLWIRPSAISFVQDQRKANEIAKAFLDLRNGGNGQPDVFDDDPVRPDEYEAGFATTLFFGGNDGRDYPFKRLAFTQYGGHGYYLLAPDFAIPGADANEALVYRTEMDPQAGHILVYETDQRVVDKIWDLVQSNAGGGSSFGGDDEDPFM